MEMKRLKENERHERGKNYYVRSMEEIRESGLGYVSQLRKKW